MRSTWAGLLAVLLGCADSTRTAAPSGTAGSAATTVTAPAVSDQSNSDSGAAGADATISPDANTDDRPAPAAKSSSGTSKRGALTAQQEAEQDDAGLPAQPQEPSYSTTEPVEVHIELAQADWDKLRKEGRTLPEIASGCEDTFPEYTSFSAKVTIGGQSLTGVEVHKKGFLGSLSMFRPSLALDFGADERGNDRMLAGFKRLTLNNNRQDRTNARQCLAYELFSRAGVHAPQCGLSHVFVNGNDLGYYTNVEPIKKPFLKRSFGEKSGNLYELDTPTDFITSEKSRFELKGSPAKPDTTDLDTLFAALQVADDQLIAALEPVVALDEYVSFWAMEAILGQWDGMTGNGNNSFLYHSKQDGRFHPIPWGADAAFTNTHNLFPKDTALSVFTSTQISRRLWALPEWQARYEARLRELLANRWNADELLGKVRAIASLTGANAAAVTRLSTFIQEQRGALEQELSQTERPGALALERGSSCVQLTEARSAMDFTWNAEKRNASDATNMFSLLSIFQGVPGGAIDMDIRVADTPVELLPLAQLGVTGVTADDLVFIGVMGTDRRTLATTYVGVFMPLANYHPGTIEFHGFETFGAVATTDGSTFKALGVIGAGSITFDEAGTNTGDRVLGSWQGKLGPMPIRAVAGR